MLVRTQFCLFLRRWDEKRSKFISWSLQGLDKPCLSLLAEKSLAVEVAGARGITSTGEGRKMELGIAGLQASPSDRKETVADAGDTKREEQ